MRRLRVESGSLAGLTVRPGQQVRVLVDGKLTRRTYSVWRYEPSGAVELCVLDHAEGGPGARWGRTVAVGDKVRMDRPEGSFTLRPDATHHVFAGDETASVAFGAMLAALPEGARISGCVETELAADRLPLAHAGRLDWLIRGGSSLPEAVRQVLVREAGWDRRAARTKPFWSPGKRGLE